ncbi:MAG: hypothetical protein AAB546_00645 [Patescibacteria group bacterium]
MNPESVQTPQNTQPLQQNQGLNTGFGNPPQKELHIWTAPARPFKRRNREFYVTIISIAAVTGLVLFLVDGFLPVMLIISLVFLFYVLSTVEPENIQYKVTTLGIKIAEKLTPWEAMRRFWFTKRFDSELLVIETYTLPGRLELVINSAEKPQLEQELKKYLVLEEAPASFLDKSSNWFAKKLPQG